MVADNPNLPPPQRPRPLPSAAQQSAYPAFDQAMQATQQITAALETCAAIKRCLVERPTLLSLALRTTIKHTESSLLTVLHDLQYFRDLIKVDITHE